MYSAPATEAICAFISDVVENIKAGDCEICITMMFCKCSSLSVALDVLTQLTPALHGMYRAISSRCFTWSLSQWQMLADQLKYMCSPDMVDHLNHLITDLVESDDSDEGTLQFVQTFLARYISRGRPLSGYFIVCCVIETLWTVLAQVLAPPPADIVPGVSEAAAANKAWNSLMRQAAMELDIADQKTVSALNNVTNYAMQCFTDLLVQIEEMDQEPSLDTYAWETMSESLVRFDLALYLHQPFTLSLETGLCMLNCTSQTR